MSVSNRGRYYVCGENKVPIPMMNERTLTAVTKIFSRGLRSARSMKVRKNAVPNARLIACEKKYRWF